jgi:hypothetical protein
MHSQVLLLNCGNSGTPEKLFFRLWDEAVDTALGDLHCPRHQRYSLKTPARSDRIAQKY